MQQQRNPQERAPRREEIGGIQVASAHNLIHSVATIREMFFLLILWQPRSTLADINRHLPGHVHVNYSLTDGQQLVRDVAGRRRVMELMMRSSDQVRPVGLQRATVSEASLWDLFVVCIACSAALLCAEQVHSQLVRGQIESESR